MNIDKEQAKAVLREEARLARSGSIDSAWEAKVERLSQLCAAGVSKTHIAFLGTVMIAKAVAPTADLFAIKPEHAMDNPRAFSARTLSEAVLVPIAAELGIHIGVTGRQPLNNQPYFRMTHLGDKTPIHRGGRDAFSYMLELVRELDNLADTRLAREALRAFIAVRQRYQPRYTSGVGDAAVAPEHLSHLITTFVRENSEGGRRAQAVVAGLLDVFAGTGRVESGRVNDPSRRSPGDVCVRSPENVDAWEKAFEVRDKPVSQSDIQIFAKRCVDMGVREAAVVMVSDNQQPIDCSELNEWATSFGIGLTVFHGLDDIVEQALFWAEAPKPDAAALAIEFIEHRLISIEASPEAVLRWQQITRGED